MASETDRLGTARRRTLLVAVAVVALLGAVIALAIATRQSGPSTASLGSPVLPSLPVVAKLPVRSSTTVPRPPATAVAPATTTPSPTPTPTTVPHPATTNPVDPATTVPASVPPWTAAPGTAATILLLPAITATLPPPPPPLGPNVLTWTAPASLAMPTNTTASFSVIAHNPTDRDVAMPHPLSCTPRLDHREMCPQVVQLVPSRTSAGATYTIDAHGVAAGHYTLKIEGVLTVAVTVS